MMRSLLFVAALLLAACGQSTIESVSGLEAPLQTRLNPSRVVGHIDNYTITAVEEYEFEALILSTRRYRWDTESVLSPVDFLIAWGPVAEDNNPNSIRWSQSWRWARYRYSPGETPLRQRAIDTNTANTHIIPDPADSELRRNLMSVRRGDIVRLRGYLVNVTRPDGWRWNTSRTRTDTGGGACEIMFVTEMY